ncbi:MAG: 16S rRNA (cytosine(967)-C(5))-methyltransferase RsmB [Nitrospirae bacterium]|nr:16S rRNA (cytosine(967)-C(5))-methyltransferase RsmB [Nitrospirota bacterium]
MKPDARGAAWDILCLVEAAKQADLVLERGLRSPGLKPLDRAFITELVYGVLRRRSYLDWAIGRFSTHRRRQSVKLKNLLRLGAYQILFLDRVPASAAVNESVRLAKTLGEGAIAGFVNAVLRAMARAETIPLPAPADDPVLHLSVKYSHPEWLVKRWLPRLGAERTAALCAANNEIPPVTVRVNTLRTTRDALSAELKRAGIEVTYCRVSSSGLMLRGVAHLTELPAYQRGDFYVQDEAAQLVGLAVNPKPGERILDACAAPGGKSTHLAELMGDRGEVVAADAGAKRLERIVENAGRLSLASIRPIVADLTGDPAPLGKAPYDRILVDAPCSGLGILRRNPEAKWYKAEAVIGTMAAAQLKILAAVAPLLKHGGLLVYSTCTTEPEENEAVIGAFLAGHPDFRNVSLQSLWPESPELITPEGYLNTLLNPYQMDQFFAAKLIRATKGA